MPHDAGTGPPGNPPPPPPPPPPGGPTGPPRRLDDRLDPDSDLGRAVAERLTRTLAAIELELAERRAERAA